jgi:hypothetical protein
MPEERLESKRSPAKAGEMPSKDPQMTDNNFRFDRSGDFRGTPKT